MSSLPTKPVPTKLSPIALRLGIIFKEWQKQHKGNKKGLRPFAELLGSSSSSIHNMLNDRQAVSRDVIDAVCAILGYSHEWVSGGTGKKMAEAKDRSTLYDVQMMRLEIEALRNEVARLNARMKAYEEKPPVPQPVPKNRQKHDHKTA